MTYKENLVKANEYNIDSRKLHTAQIVSDVFDNANIKPTDEEFEKVCEYICNCATSTDYASTYLLASVFTSRIDKRTTIEELLKEDFNQFVDKVVQDYNTWA